MISRDSITDEHKHRSLIMRVCLELGYFRHKDVQGYLSSLLGAVCVHEVFLSSTDDNNFISNPRWQGSNDLLSTFFLSFLGFIERGEKKLLEG